MRSAPAQARRGARGVPARVFAFLFVAGAFALACGVSVPPSGGPEDTTPPRVTGTIPAPDSAGVGTDSEIRITFSEDMTRARVERQVFALPTIAIDRVRWEGRTLVVVPQGPLRRDTTYVVQVKPGYRDHHGVAAKTTYEFAFATGAEIDTARIEGVVYFKREPSGRSVVRCFRLPRGEDFDPAAARPDRETATGTDGTYRLRYLSANDARFVVFGFVDVNGNGQYESAGEPSVVLPDTIVLSSAVPVAGGVNLAIIDPREPAVVSGTVENDTGIDTVRVSVRMVGVDEGKRARLYGFCDAAGAFEFRDVMAGRYVLQAFLDLRADSVCGAWACPDTAGSACREPCAQLADTLQVAPGASVRVPALKLRRDEE